MRPKRPFKIMALVTALLLVGGMVAPAFGDCDSPCCSRGAPRFHPMRAVPTGCPHVETFVDEIKGASCRMGQVPAFSEMQGACSTVFRTERPAAGVYAILSWEVSPEGTSPRDPARTAPRMTRAAPQPLYLQNLSLLI